MLMLKQTREQERAERHQEAARKALFLYRNAKPADPRHPYLARKGIQSHTARQKGDALLLLIGDAKRKPWSLQFIQPDGSKRMLTGGRKKGCFIHVAGSDHEANTILICEGFATGATLAESQPDALVLAAIDAGNLEPVALAIRSAFPMAGIIICGDDDRQAETNTGRIKARQAAIACSGKVAFPCWPPDSPLSLTDFNDLATWMQGGSYDRAL